MPRTKIEEGVYVDRDSGNVIIHLNKTNETANNGINLLPPNPVPEPGRGRQSVTIRRAALKRMYEAMFPENL